MAMRKTKIKELNQRITFFKRVEVGTDSEDYPVYQSEDIFTTWAKAESGGTKEDEENRATFDRTDIVFTIRYRKSAEISNDMFIRHLGLEYEITGIEPVDFGREYLKISAKRTVMQ